MAPSLYEGQASRMPLRPLVLFVVLALMPPLVEQTVDLNWPSYICVLWLSKRHCWSCAMIDGSKYQGLRSAAS